MNITPPASTTAARHRQRAAAVTATMLVWAVGYACGRFGIGAVIGATTIAGCFTALAVGVHDTFKRRDPDPIDQLVRRQQTDARRSA